MIVKETAWYYYDPTKDYCYWSYASEYSMSEFAHVISDYLGITVNASNVLSAPDIESLELIQKGSHTVRV